MDTIRCPLSAHVQTSFKEIHSRKKKKKHMDVYTYESDKEDDTRRNTYNLKNMQE